MSRTLELQHIRKLQVSTTVKHFKHRVTLSCVKSDYFHYRNQTVHQILSLLRAVSFHIIPYLFPIWFPSSGPGNKSMMAQQCWEEDNALSANSSMQVVRALIKADTSIFFIKQANRFYCSCQKRKMLLTIKFLFPFSFIIFDCWFSVGCTRWLLSTLRWNQLSTRLSAVSSPSRSTGETLLSPALCSSSATQ